MCLEVIAEVKLGIDGEAPVNAHLLLEPWVLKKFEAKVGGGPVMTAVCPRI